MSVMQKGTGISQFERATGVVPPDCTASAGTVCLRAPTSFSSSGHPRRSWARARLPTRECPAAGRAADYLGLRTLGSLPMRIASTHLRKRSALLIRNDRGRRVSRNQNAPDPCSSEKESAARIALAAQSESPQGPDTTLRCTSWSRPQLASLSIFLEHETLYARQR